MAQQTQIGRVGPAWRAFLERFPTVEALASASVADVLREWRGLGYNSRALNLQRAARLIVAEHGGRVPETVEALERLPGIGPYTARAVAAIAFGSPVGAVDTNVRRVLRRVVAGDDRAIAPRPLQALADAVVPEERAADWTHAVMDIGSAYCRTSAPTCAPCPLRDGCRYALRGGSGASARPADPVQAPTRTPAPVSRAGRPATPRASSGRVATPFPLTTRWLRGRILDRLRDEADGAWVPFAEPIGAHPAEAVVGMLSILAREGLVEVAPDEPALARLPTG